MTTQRLPIRPTTRTASLLHEAWGRIPPSRWPSSFVVAAAYGSSTTLPPACPSRTNWSASAASANG